MLLKQHIEFLGVPGVQHLDLKLSDKQMNVLIGSNGVGKTKALESLYTLLLFSNRDFARNHYVYQKHFVFQKCVVNSESIYQNRFSDDYFGYQASELLKLESEHWHDLPVIYLAAQHRGEIRTLTSNQITPLGEYAERRQVYFDGVLRGMSMHFSSLNMDTPIEEWFIQRALSANDYQDSNDNREVELLTVLRVLHKIDSRISPKKCDFKVIGSKSVAITVDGELRRLSELSSGFASLIKIVQSIVAGYSFFTNAVEIESLAGYVLIDEIESHLHIEWQTKILPLLMDVFPNTYFIVTTHSSLVLAQLSKGKAFQLVKESGKVSAKELNNPSQAALIDLLEDAFNVNMNALKLKKADTEHYTEAKAALLSLLGD